MALVTVQRSPSPSNTASEEVDETDDGSNLKSPNRSRSFSESYFTVKGAALILPQNEVEATYTKKICKSSHGDIQSHLEAMIALLRRQDTIAVAVKLEVNVPDRHKYMAVVSCMGKQDTEESVILGIDFNGNNNATIGLVLPIWADTYIELDGDGGFRITSAGNKHLFKPVTVQVMWFTLQSLNKLVKIARENKYICNGLSHTWVHYYETCIKSDIPRISEWNMTEDLLFFKAEPVVLPTDDDDGAFLKRIKVELKNVMMKEDLEEATSRYLRTKLEEQMNMKLDKWKGFIDQEMLTILGQMDSPTMIKDFLYLGSEWNASNIEELTKNGVSYIMNISREIDNFFPGILHYYNIKEWDSEETDLLKHWEHTHKFICKVREKNGKVLVHCKMGISRSATTVLAFLMKEYNMTRQEAYDYVKEKRSCIMPNKSFWHQLETYEGILNASNQRHLFKKRSELNISERDKERVEKEEMCNPDVFLGAGLEHSWNKPSLDESYPEVFLKDNSDACSYDFDAEIGSSSRSADSNEDCYPDLPSPQLEGATGGVKVFLDQESEGSSDDDDEQNEIDIDIDEIEGDCNLDYDKKFDLEPDKKGEVKSLSDFGIHQHYLKENIPWSAGTVKKTKEGLEGKFKDTPSSSNLKNISGDKSVETVGDEIKIIITDETKSEQILHPIDGVTETETSDDKVDEIETKETEVKRPTSVYDMEDIPLPPGIVRRTTQEIEERNRLDDGSLNTKMSLQRSSSLKTERDARRKKRNLERRKTITPILSPCTSTSDASPTKDLSFSDVIGNDSVFLKQDLSFSQNEEKKDLEMLPLCDNEKKDFPIVDNNESASKNEKLEEPDLTVYKFLGEEVQLERGIVKRQKMGIELKSRERLSSEPEKTESSGRSKKTTDNEGANSAPTTPTGKQKDSAMPTAEVRKIDSPKFEDISAIETLSCDSIKQSEGLSKDQKDIKDNKAPNALERDGTKTDIEERMPLFSEAKENFEKASAKAQDSDVALWHTPKSKKKESRFDAATLELIREIGSAILNSPAKKDVEDYEESEAKLGSGLVRHFVKNIEKQTKVQKKQREIIIIDKDSKKKNWRWSNPVDQPKVSTPSADQPGQKNVQKRLVQSLSSPLLMSPTSGKFGNKHGIDSDLSPLTGSPPNKNGEQYSFTGSPPRKSGEQYPVTSSPSLKSRDQSKNVFDRGNESTPLVTDAAKKKTPITGSQSKDLNFTEDNNSSSVKGLAGRYASTSEVVVQNTYTSLPNIKEVNSCDSLKNLETVSEEKKETSVQDSAINRQSDSEDPPNEDCVILRKMRNQLKTANRPKLKELVRRYSTSPNTDWFGINSSSDENPEEFTWEGKKVRKLQGKTHPLTKLEWRKKYYNTM